MATKQTAKKETTAKTSVKKTTKKETTPKTTEKKTTKKETTPKAVAKKTTKKTVNQVSEDDIRARAQKIYDQRIKNGIPGNAESDWVQAEKELLK